MVRALPFIVIIALMVWAIVDIVLIRPERVQGLPKPAWILIALIPVVGPLLWILLGRQRLNRRPATVTGPKAPDDDPEFLRRLNHDAEQQQRIRDLEERLAELDDDDPKP